MNVHSKVHGKDAWVLRFYRDGVIPYREGNGTTNCGYCGSMSPADALRLLKEPDCHASGADWKYGWPHKFYIRADGIGIKFYSRHLYDATKEEFTELTNILASKLGVRFSIDQEGLYYVAPHSGYQTWFGSEFDAQAPKVPEGM